MLTDTIKVLRTSELPDGSRAWVVVAIHSREEGNALVWEVHVATKTNVESHVFSTEYPSDSPVSHRDEQENDQTLTAAIKWARQHIAQQWAKHENFTGLELTDTTLNQINEARFLRELPDTFMDIVNVTHSTALKLWMAELALVPQFRRTETNQKQFAGGG